MGGGNAMPHVALAGVLAYAALAFGVRSLIQWRRTGRTGFVGVSATAGRAEWLGGALLVVSLAAAVAAPVLALTGVAPPWPAPAGVHAAGLALYLLGTAATLWSQLAMGDSWRIGVDPAARTSLVVGGPFRRVRNPIFTSMLVTTLGVAMLVPGAASAIAVAALLVGLEIQVRLVEEPYLLRVHGPAYRAYAAHAGRFLPGIGRLRPLPDGDGGSLAA
jgi:protein-S-isoprenylcysteine O-methyltransferase Ste14